MMYRNRLLFVLGSVSAWSGEYITTTTTAAKTRRWFVQSAVLSTATAVVAPPALAVFSKEDLLEDLRISKEKLQAIPALLEDKEWDRVRTVLKLPPVNKLWNAGDVSAENFDRPIRYLKASSHLNSLQSQNIVLQLAKETGNIDLFELKEELAYNLQICDQLTYDNAFVYFQPGNGKFKIKEPQQLAAMAMKQIQEVIDLANANNAD